MKTRELLENDKERLLVKLGEADSPDKTVRTLEEELNRIQIRYGENESDEALSREASYALETAKAALSLVDSTGEIRTYERTGPSGKDAKGRYLIPLGSGFGAGVLGAMLMTVAPSAMVPLCVILIIGGLGLTFVGGYNFGKRKQIPARSEQIVDVRMDSEKIYRSLNSMLTVVDHNLEDARLTFADTAASGSSSPDDVDDEELRLLSALLETAYSSGDSDDARQTISDITFYLHRRGVEVIPYSEETAKYFNRMPAAFTGTLKPALVKDSTVLIRGMAAVKSH